MADLKKVSCPNCHQKYRLPDSIENRKVVCRGCQFTFAVPGVGANGQSPSEKSASGSEGGMFDSLDVDNLLNAQSSGLSQRRPDPIPSNDKADDAEPFVDPVPIKSKAPSTKKRNGQKGRSKRKSKGSSERTTKKDKSGAEADDRHQQGNNVETPSQPSALPITVLDRSRKKSGGKKKKKGKSWPSDIESGGAVSDVQREVVHDATSERGVEAIDPQEQAVFDYARAVNGRNNAFALILATAIAIALGGWFFVEEIARLKLPLTAREREMLEEEGFRLKAARAPRKGHFAALGRDVPRVGVAPGARADQFDQPEAGGDAGEVFDPNAAFDDPNRQKNNQRKPPKKVRPVEFDTRVVAEAKASSFTVGGRRVLGPALALSPRNVVFVPEGKGIASYDLETKKRIDYKTVGRWVGKLDKVVALAATLDGRFMVAGFESGRVKLFQLDSIGKFFEIIKLDQHHFRPINQIAVSPDSQLVATIDADAEVIVWRVSTGETIWKRRIENSPIKKSEQACLDLAFASDGQQLLAAMKGADVVVDARDGTAVSQKERPPRKSAILSPSNRSSVGSTETDIIAFSLDAETVLWKKSIRKSQASAFAVAAGGVTGLFFDGGSSIVEFDLQTGALLNRHAPVDGSFNQPDSKLTVSANGRYLLCGLRNYPNGKLRVNLIEGGKANEEELPDLPPTLKLPKRSVPDLWGVTDGKRSRKLKRVSLPESGGEVSTIALSADGLLFYSTASGSLHVYDWTNGVMVQEVRQDNNQAISALALCGKWLAAGKQSGGILLYEVQPSGKLEPHEGVFGHDRAVVGLSSLPLKLNSEKKEPDSIASLSKDGNLRVWEIPTRGSLLNLQTFREAPKALVVLNDRKILVASTTHLATINLDTQKVSVEGSRQGGSRVAVSPDGKKLAFVNRKEITIAKTKTGVVGKPVSLKQNPGAIQFTRDSRMLQIVFPDHVALVNYRTGRTVDKVAAKIRPHSELDTPFAISPDQSVMAAVTSEGQKIIIVPVEK